MEVRIEANRANDNDACCLLRRGEFVQCPAQELGVLDELAFRSVFLFAELSAGAGFQEPDFP